MKKFLKFKNLFFVTFLAVAGFFSYAAASANIKSEKNPVVEKAEAATSTDSSATKVTIVDFYNWSFRTLHIWNLDLSTTASLDGTSTTRTYGNTEFESFLTSHYGARNDNMDYYTSSGAWKKSSDTDYYIRTSSYTKDHEGSARQCCDYCFPSWIKSFSYQYTNGDTWGDTHSISSGGSKQWRSKFTNYNSDYDYGTSPATANFTSFSFTIKGAGTRSGTIRTDTNQIGYYYYNPTVPAANDGETFDGWYTDSTCTTKYTLETHSSATTLYAKFISCKYVYLTDNCDWGGTIKSTATSNGVGIVSTMTGMYANGSGKWVYYSVIPSDTTKLVFSSTNGKYTRDISITSSDLNNTNAWYTSGTSNPYSATSWTITSDNHPRFSGEKYYLFVSGEGISDNSGYALHFFDKCGETVTASAWTSLGTEVTDAGTAFGQSYKIYEFTVPGTNMAWPAMIATRYNPAKNPPTDGKDGIWNQTDDIWFTGEWHTVQLTGYTGGSKLNKALTDTYTKTSVYSMVFGYHVLSKTNGVCVQDGSTNTTILASRWTTLKTEYNSYDSDIQGAIRTATTTDDDNLSKGMKRYDYIALYKYPSLIGSGEWDTDFVHRATSSNRAYNKQAIQKVSPFELILEDENSLPTVIIIVASSVALLSITALSVLVIKKRKSKEQ